MKTFKAYTLIELLLSIALISMVLALSLPVFSNFQYKNELVSAQNLTVRALRSAQTFAQAVSGDSTWGVYFLNNTVTVFKGLTYATRDSAFDINDTYAGNIVISGLTEILYSKFTGFPTTTGTLTIGDNANSKQITINAKGNLQY